MSVTIDNSNMEASECMPHSGGGHVRYVMIFPKREPRTNMNEYEMERRITTSSAVCLMAY